MIPSFTLFGITVRTYTLMAVLAAVTFTALCWRPLRRRGLPVWGAALLLAAIWVAFPVGARVLYAATSPESYSDGAVWYELKMTGFSVYGGLFGALAAILSASAIARVRPVALLDAVTVPGAVSFCVARVGCFLNGCCAGKETDLLWGVVFPSRADGAAPSHAVHPTHLYELILALIGVPLCLFIVKKARAGEGGMFFLYSVWFCTMRLAVHPLREFTYSTVVTNIFYPMLYYVLIVVGVFLFVWSCRKGGESVR